MLIILPRETSLRKCRGGNGPVNLVATLKLNYVKREGPCRKPILIMKIRTATFESSAPDLATCPASKRLEFAFIGRSNVGKSSLINMLTRQKDLAKVSGTPGKTKLINFFTINNKWTLVDLPGYGYAKTAKRERMRFSRIVTDYLENRQNLAGTFVLIDSMLPPQKLDLAFLEWMVECELPFILLFTKADRHSKAAATKNIEAFLTCMDSISGDRPEYILTSAKLAQGQGEILDSIAAALDAAREAKPEFNFPLEEPTA